MCMGEDCGLMLFELARSSRLVCRKCGGKIAKGAVIVRNGSHDVCHLCCVDTDKVRSVMNDVYGESDYKCYR